MFKKPIKIGTSHQQSSKDRKTFRKDIKKNFDGKAVEQLFQNVDQFTVNKVEKSKMIIYNDEEDPFFVDSTSKKDYFPTIYALQAFPTLQQHKLYLKKGVEDFIMKGANLMWPGVDGIEQLEDFQADEVVTIFTSDKKVFAVGAYVIGSDEVKGNMGKVEGMAAFILHYKGDHLYQLGSQIEKETVFDGVEKHDQKKEEELEEKLEQIEKEEKIDEMDMMKFIKNTNTRVTASKQTKNSKPVKGKKGKGKKKDYFESDEEKNQKGQQQKEKKEEKGDKVDQNEKKQQDDWIMEAFLNAVSLKLDDGDLPIENANFWNNYILTCKNPKANLDIKKSSHKKLGKLFSNLDKQGLIKYKEASKKQSTPQITQIMRVNKKISEWIPTVDQVDEVEEDNEEQEIQIIDTIKEYITPKEYHMKYLDPQPETDSLEIEDFEKAVKKHFSDKNGYVMASELNPEDFDIDQEEESEEEGDEEEDEDEEKEEQKKKKRDKVPHHERKFTIDEIIQQMKKKSKFYFTYVQPRPELPEKEKVVQVKGKFQGIQILAEKSHNRFVTKIRNLHYYQVDTKVMMDILKKKFDTAASLRESGTEIMLQGTFHEQVKDYLVLELKVKESQIDVVDKVSKKKKKEGYSI